MSESRLSTRLSLRWPPDPPFENTDTLVLSVKNWYVDLRVDKQSGTIDWAIAGQRIVESQEPLRVLFTHELDSRNSFESVDCGTFTTLPSGDDLEKGSMPRPDLPGAPVAEYEEVWRELEFPGGPEAEKKGVSWILESESESELDPENGVYSEGKEVHITKTFLGRIWGVYTALQQPQIHIRCKNPDGDWVVTEKRGGEVSARREEWVPSSPASSTSTSGWREKYVLGPEGENVPSLRTGLGGEGQGQGAWRVPGEKIVIGGRQYVVRAFAEIV